MANSSNPDIPTTTTTTTTTTTPSPHPSINPLSPALRLRHLLHTHPILALPGVYDGLTAHLALRQSFPALYMTGAGTAASTLGLPDLGLASLPDMLHNAAMLASLDRKVPVIADADTGYGDPLMVARTVRSYIQAGVAGLHLEDQVVQKRCGHLLGKEVVGREEFYARIRAAVLAREQMRDEIGGDIVIIARTDALQSYGMEEALTRLKACVEIGVDVVFLEGLTTTQECREVCTQMAPTPVLYNCVPGGVSPELTVDEARDLGFKIVIYPTLALSKVIEGVGEAFRGLKETGRADVSDEARRLGVKQIFSLCGLEREVEFDKRAGGKAFGNGV